MQKIFLSGAKISNIKMLFYYYFGVKFKLDMFLTCTFFSGTEFAKFFLTLDFFV